MANEVEVRGVEQLEELGRKLKAADKSLKLELSRNMRLAVKPAQPDIRASLAGGLPKSGGLAALMAKATVGARVRTAGNSVGVRVSVQHGKSLMKTLDEGKLRHKVFGRKPWVEQSVPEGLISKPFDRMRPLVTRGVLAAMDHTSKQLTK